MTKRRDRRPTIIDVAERAGVSKSTVARALADAAEINPTRRATRCSRPREAAGYERNHLAVGMRSGRSGMIGLVIPDIANPFWAEVARGAQDRAAEHGVSLLVFSSDWDHDREARHLQALRQARVDGAIINPVADSFDDLDRFGLPFVLIGSSAERFPETSSVGSDIAQAVRLGPRSPGFQGTSGARLILGPKSRIARARFLRVGPRPLPRARHRSGDPGRRGRRVHGRGRPRRDAAHAGTPARRASLRCSPPTT